MNQYNRDANFVRPAPEDKREQAPEPHGIEAMMVQDSIHVGQPLSAHHGAHEQTSGMDRSKSLVVRLVPFTIIWFILAVSVAWMAGMGGAWALIVFSGLTAVTYGLMDKREYMYSRNGLERHKVDTLASLKELEIIEASKTRNKWLDAQIRQLERGDNARTIEGTTTAGRGQIETKKR